MGRAVYHIDFGDGINAGDIKTHSNFNRTLYHRQRRRVSFTALVGCTSTQMTTVEQHLLGIIIKLTPTIEIRPEVAVVSFHQLLNCWQ